MPRPPRIWFPGAWYHIMARGNNREAIFFSEYDYREYLQLLRDILPRDGCCLHAYALMPNHIHLMVETGEVHPIAKPMQSLQTSYTGYINHRYARVGHVFQGRYRSILVEHDPYVLELSRYIHLNPVRARLVTEPSQYPWSSYQAYVTPRGKEANLVTTEHILAMISPQTETQRDGYRQFVIDGLAMRRDLLAEVVEHQFLGSPTFVESALRGHTGSGPGSGPGPDPSLVGV